MLILNPILKTISCGNSQNFKTSYVDIKQKIICKICICLLHFKTSYVDIKRIGLTLSTSSDCISKHHMLILNVFLGIISLRLAKISKHHMLILNFYIFENEYELNPNFKTSYVDIKLYSVLLQVLKYCYFKTSYVDIKLFNFN